MGDAEWTNYSALACSTSGMWVMDKFSGKIFVSKRHLYPRHLLSKQRKERGRAREREKPRGLSSRQLPCSARTSL